MTRFRILFISALLAAAFAAPATAQRAEPRVPAVSVTGEATVSQAPDLAILQAGVTSQEKTARQAMTASGQLMKAVLAALKQAGIADADIQTSRLRLEPIREQRRGNNPAAIIAVEASSLITVQMRDVEKAADILDRMISAGANLVTGISFTISAPSKLLDQARVEAMTDARQKAEIYAKAAGLTLGPAISIAESYIARPVRPMMAREAAVAMPVAAGEEKLTLTVNVSYELLR
jgi:uncharacterized protein YggE